MSNEKLVMAKVSRCVENIRRTRPQYALGLMTIERIYVPDLGTTFSTNGKWLKVSDEILPLPDCEVEFMLKHEDLHRLQKHSLRLARLGDSVDVTCYRYAADLAVNSILVQSGDTPPKECPGFVPGMGDFRFLPLGKDTEFYYNELRKKIREEMERQKQEEQDEDSEGVDGEDGDKDSGGDGGSGQDSDGKDEERGMGDSDPDGDTGDEEGGGDVGDRDGGDGDGSGSGDSGDEESAEDKAVRLVLGEGEGPQDLEPSDTPPDKMAEEEQQVNQSIQLALDAANSMGLARMDALTEFMAGQLKSPTIPWERQLRQYMTSTEHNRLSFRRPNRRNFQDDLLLPSRGNRTLGKTLIVADVSGSMYGYMQRVVNEVTNLVRPFPHSEVDLVLVDTQIQATYRIGKYKEQNILEKVPWKKGGGTDMTPGFKYAEGKDYQLIICVTDLCLPCVPPRPKIPVIWCVPEECKQTVAYGNLVLMTNN